MKERVRGLAALTRVGTHNLPVESSVQIKDLDGQRDPTHLFSTG